MCAKHVGTITIVSVKEQQENTKVEMSAEVAKNYRKARVCHICNGAFTETNEKVRDHCIERDATEEPHTTLVILTISRIDTYPWCFTTFAATTAT